MTTNTNSVETLGKGKEVLVKCGVTGFSHPDQMDRVWRVDVTQTDRSGVQRTIVVQPIKSNGLVTE